MDATTRQYVLRAFIRAAATDPSDSTKTVDPRPALLAVITGRFSNDVATGKTVIHTAEAGGDVTFAFNPGMGVPEIIALAEEALEWVSQQPDPSKPNLNRRRIQRLRVSFAKTTFSQNVPSIP